MDSKILNEHLKGVADAIRAKKGTTELINPQDFAEEINAISGGNGGGELEGEYFLAKPNGRYWKSKLASMERGKYPVITNNNGEVFTDEELEMIDVYCHLFAGFGYTATYDYGGIPTSGREVILKTPTDVANRAGMDKVTLSWYNSGDRTFFSCMGAWQECDIHRVLEDIVFDGGLVDYIRILFESEIGAVTDNEVLTFISDMFMLEQVTKEEYESYYNWN